MAIWNFMYSHPAVIAIAVFIVITAWGYFAQRHKNPKRKEVIQVVDIYEDNIGECGLIFHNTGENPLGNCQSQLLDLAFETPHNRWSLGHYPKVEAFVCDQNVAGFGNGKIPLFRWGKGTESKSLEIVYKKGTESIGYGVTNVPILMLLNLWADGTQNTYAICKLEDRRGWGYRLSILKTGLQQDNTHLATFQTKVPDKKGSQSLGDGTQPKSYDKRDVIISREQKDFAILWVGDYGHFEDYTRGTDRPFLGVNSYIVFKPGRGRITVESLWLDIAGIVAETSGQWTTKTFAKEETHNLQFGIPPNIPRGQRTVKLVAIVDGSEIVCDEFTIDLPPKK